jgi:hypothetical protein
VLLSRSRKEPHLLVGAGAVKRCGSSSDNGIEHGWELKMDTKYNRLLPNTHSVHIFSKINRSESYEQDSLNMSLNLSYFQKIFLAV